MEKVTQQNTAAAEETASAAVELAETARKLREILSRHLENEAGAGGNFDDDYQDEPESGAPAAPRQLPDPYQEEWPV